MLWYTPSAGSDDRRDKTQPNAAIVSYAWSDRLVNLTVFRHDGFTYAAASITLLQEDDKPSGFNGYAQWMPYQRDQAKKDGA